MGGAELKIYCKECGLLTEYTDPSAFRREFGPSWPFEVGEADVPSLQSLPLAKVRVCACRIGKTVEGREIPCEAFSPGC